MIWGHVGVCFAWRVHAWGELARERYDGFGSFQELGVGQAEVSLRAVVDGLLEFV